MNDSSPDILVQQFLDGTLDPEAEADALRRIAEDPQARALLQVEGKLQRWLAEEHRHRHAVPPDFTDRVMHAVDAAAEAPETTPRGKSTCASSWTPSSDHAQWSCGPLMRFRLCCCSLRSRCC